MVPPRFPHNHPGFYHGTDLDKLIDDLAREFIARVFQYQFHRLHHQQPQPLRRSFYQDPRQSQEEAYHPQQQGVRNRNKKFPNLRHQENRPFARSHRQQQYSVSFSRQNQESQVLNPFGVKTEPQDNFPTVPPPQTTPRKEFPKSTSKN